MRIVCDTNIWYGIGNGSIALKTIQGLELIATFNCIAELSRSPNLVLGKDKLLQVKNAATALMSKSTGFIMHYSLESIIIENIKNFRPNYEQAHSVLESLRLFTRTDINNIEDQLIDDIARLISDLKSPMDEITNHFNNQMLPEIRAHIKNTEGKKAHREKENIDGILSLILKMIDEYLTNSYGRKSNLTELKINDPFLTVFSYFMKELEVNPSGKFHSNDWYDLFNLAYVEDGMLYWTNEKRWLSIIDNAGMGHFLFKPTY